MECEAQVELIKLLSDTRKNVVVRIVLGQEAVTIHLGGKVEKFRYKKIRQKPENGMEVFQSDGLKLAFARNSQDVHQRLSEAVAKGRLDLLPQKPQQTSASSQPSVPPPQSSSSHVSASSIQHRVSKTSLCASTKVTDSRQSVKAPQKKAPVPVGVSASTKTKSSSASTGSKASPETDSIISPGSGSKKSPATQSPSPSRVKLSLDATAAHLDVYDHMESSPLSPDRPTASPDTLFPTTDASHVQSPIPTVLQKYGRKSSNPSTLLLSGSGAGGRAPMRVVHDSTPFSSLYSDPTAIRKSSVTGRRSGTSAFETESAAKPPLAARPAPVPKPTMMTALQKLSASHASLGLPRADSRLAAVSGMEHAGVASGAGGPAPRTGTAAGAATITPSTPVTTVRRPTSPPKDSWGVSPAQAAARLATLNAVDLTEGPKESHAGILKAAAPPSQPQPQSWYRNYFTSQSAAEKPKAALRPRLPGGVRNLGNTCYISAVVQALCAQNLLQKRLSAPFWDSVIALQSAAPSTDKTARDGLPAVAPRDTDAVSIGNNSLCPDPTMEVGADESAMVASGADAGAQATTPRAATPPAIAGGKEMTAQAVASSQLEKYRVHSVLRELCTMIRQKVQWTSEAAPASINTSSSGFGFSALLQAAKVLDVTRLKRAVSHHTGRYDGYSQQDAHEFFSDLLLLVEEETTARWQALRSAWLATHQPQLAADSSVMGGTVLATPGRVSSDNDEDVVGGKRAAAQQLVGTDLKKRRQEEGPVLTPQQQLQLRLPVAESFHSSICVDMRCLCCGYKYPAKYEPYQHLSLDLAAPHSGSSSVRRAGSGEPLHVDKLLGAFFSEETRELTCEQCAVSGGRQGQDPRSPDAVAHSMSATKPPADSGRAATSTSLAVAPRVLVLQLKRFHYDAAAQDMVKIHTEVTFPAALDVTSFLSASAKPATTTTTSSATARPENEIWSHTVSSVLQGEVDPAALQEMAPAPIDCARTGKYALTAVVRHLGSTERSGHYICDVCVPADTARGGGDGARSTAGLVGQWRRCDDSNVYPIDQDAVLSERRDPYLLFYTAIS